MANAGEIKAKLELDISSFNRNLSRARQSMTQLGITANAVSQSINQIGNGSVISANQLRSLTQAQRQLLRTTLAANATQNSIRNIHNTQIFGPQINQQIININNQLNNTRNAAAGSTDAFNKLRAAAMALGAVAAVGLGASIAAAVNFEQKLKDVEAVAGASKEQMRQLGDLAKEMGAKTAFSASEAAMGIEELVKAGLTVEQILNGGLQGALDLATAGGLELAEASEIASTALNAFKSDALSVTDAANILAGAANASATDVHELRYGLSMTSAVAAGVGLSFKDVSTSLALFAQAGLKGSDGGTSLKTMLLNLSPSTEGAATQMGKLGLLTKEGTSAFYDAEGSIKSMADIAELLKTKLANLSDEQRQMALKTMFGTDAIRAANILYKAGAQGINEMTDALSKVTAAEVAATKLDTLKGAFEEFKGVAETLGITIGEDFLPILTDLAKGITEVLRGLNETDMANIKAGLSFAAVTSAVLLLGGGIMKLVTTTRLLFASLGPAGWIITGISLLSGLLVGARVRMDELNEVNLEGVEALKKQRDALNANIDEYDKLATKSRLSNDELARFVDLNSLIKKTADPEMIAKFKAEQEQLALKSGLSNEELARMVGLNGELAKVVPDTNVTLTEQGNVLLKNTDAAKQYSAAQLEQIRNQLELERIKASANYEKAQEKEKKLIEEVNALLDERRTKEVAIQNQKAVILDIERVLADAQSANDQAAIDANETLLQQEQEKLGKLYEELGLTATDLQKKEEALEKTRQQIGALDAVVRRTIEIEAAAAGITAEKGKELDAIESTISKLQEEKKALDNNTNAAGKNTDEYREAAGAINKKIENLIGVRDRINNIIDDAAIMNRELAKEINKTVTVNERAGRTIVSGRNVGSQYHTGGIVGRGQLPMLHVGGLASQFADAPSHNEIDVRLLRNEMVFTEAQQANLMRMIDAGFNGGGAPADNSELVRLLQSMDRKMERGFNSTVVLDEYEVGRILEPVITEEQALNRSRKDRF